LLHGWANLGGGYAPLSCYKDIDGFIHLRGLITGGSYANSCAVVPFSRSYSTLFRIRAENGDATIVIDIYGNIFMASGFSGWVSFDGIVY
jgi:hypothetical protein